MSYRHTQIGYFLIFAIGSAVILTGWISLSGGVKPTEQPILNITLLLLIFLLILFSTLTVKVTRRELVWYFGPGIWKYRLPLSQIREVSVTRSNLLEGIGIRWNPRKGWLYSVSGFRAVKIVHLDGKITRIGSNEPENLSKAVRESKRYN